MPKFTKYLMFKSSLVRGLLRFIQVICIIVIIGGGVAAIGLVALGILGFLIIMIGTLFLGTLKAIEIMSQMTSYALYPLLAALGAFGLLFVFDLPFILIGRASIGSPSVDSPKYKYMKVANATIYVNLLGNLCYIIIGLVIWGIIELTKKIQVETNSGINDTGSTVIIIVAVIICLALFIGRYILLKKVKNTVKPYVIQIHREKFLASNPNKPLPPSLMTEEERAIYNAQRGQNWRY